MDNPVESPAVARSSTAALRAPGSGGGDPARRADAVLWALAGLTALGLAVRFASLGVQSYHHDEVITAARVVPGGFVHMLREVKASESNPPLYYVLAWGWAKLFGVGEVGLRSLSALFGAATVPVAYLIGRELASRRAGLIAAAIAAVNPMLIWYSQEARSYALLVFFGALSLLFFARALQRRGGRDLALWALASALALASHYFAVFAVGVEALWLLAALPDRRRAALAAVSGVAAVGLALLPLALAQANPIHIGWIENISLASRLYQTGAAFLAGETGRVIAEPSRDGYALLPAVLAGLALLLVAWRGSRRERRGAALCLVVALGVVLIPTAAALLGKDYLVERNLLPALIPLVVVAAIGLAASGARRLGLVLTLALCAYWLAFDVYVTQTPNLQRFDARALSERLGPPHGPRAIVTWKLAADPLEFYLRDGGQDMSGGRWRLREVDIATKPFAPAAALRLPRAFHVAERVRLPRLTLVRYVAKRPAPVWFQTLHDLSTGFGRNLVVIDGLPTQASLPGWVGLSGGPLAILTAPPPGSGAVP